MFQRHFYIFFRRERKKKIKFIVDKNKVINFKKYCKRRCYITYYEKNFVATLGPNII